MALEVRKKERETAQSLVRRFTQRIQKSGILLRARKTRFKKREKSEKMKKRAALRREEMKRKYEKLQKLGLTK
ncbi:MAG: 30S ribosomal protein S21 [Candidatus Nealsonbacteria bacterium CG23_combo_of_CG06-09_8_20_14_all_36_12]|uniref:30S ribosomal protein S21 n=2 Tax=Candidatus Nealsoniibacteriota TaxID=1817911 RepID=A0A2H0TNK7_9BACT|nr:MAG: 30S ribosomal protein S21 [Candidatus Nealsonbacteria bacterium CG23_combo_of_CG06-09_8_20_14_all_36_12]PIR73007.1 MAG: 30S ribosomal protein S21 [Candidatus Nealsonbacteria bacterium CG10_big_fil_rev_8_21_14_0_10_36_23]